MDSFDAFADDLTAGQRPSQQRSFLFLGGPLSRFFDELARALIARGHRAHKVNLHLGEQLFWCLPATNYRGRFEDWRGFIGKLLDEHAVTDLIFVGDRRPYHLVASEEARARGIAVICTDLGYLRPDWITVEYDGTTTLSRFPRDPDKIRALAAAMPVPGLRPQFLSPFRLVAALDVLFTVPQVLGRPLYPHYRWHGVFHPFAEYAGWLVTLARRRLTARATTAKKARLQADPGSYFMFPLQLATDFQIRAHSQYRDAREAVREVVGSFAKSGVAHKLVVVVHPLDNGLVNWRRAVKAALGSHPAAERVVVLDGGIPAELLCNAAGIVTVNSTVGVTALYQNVPVKVLGNAVFDVPGLTYRGPLDRFWHEPTPPDPGLTDAFLRALAGTTQIKGNFHARAGRAHAIGLIVERLEGGLYPLPAVSPGELARRQLRPIERTIVIVGAAQGIGPALAREHAVPGVRLGLVGEQNERFAAIVDDCRRRGARVEPLDPDDVDAFGRHYQVDLVIADSARLDAVDVLVERMRPRPRSRIAVVAGPDETASLQRRFAGVAVSLARTGWLAQRLAAATGDKRHAAVSADDAARLIRRGIEHGAARIAIPGAGRIVGRAILIAPRWLFGWPGRAYRQALDEAAAEARALAQEQTQGDD